LPIRAWKNWKVGGELGIEIASLDLGDLRLSKDARSKPCGNDLNIVKQECLAGELPADDGGGVR